MGQSQTWNGDVLHDAGNVVSDIGGWLTGPPGDPGRIRQCADQVDEPLTRFDADRRGLNESIDELTASWTGDSATQFRATWYGGGTQVAPDRVLTEAHAKLSRFSRNLRDYADQLEHAQSEHWIQMAILAAMTVVNAAQLGADPATNAAEVGVAAGTAAGTALTLADIGTMAVEGAFTGFGSDVVSQLGADLLDRLDSSFDTTGDHTVALFKPAEAVLSGVAGAGSGVLFTVGGCARRPEHRPRGHRAAGRNQVSELIKADTHWNNQPVRLFSCSTGEGADPIAQRVADNLGVTVTAPIEPVWSDLDGNSFVAPAHVEWQELDGQFERVVVAGDPMPDGWRTFTPPPPALPPPRGG